MIFVATSPAEWVAKSMDRLIDRSAWNRNSAKFTVAIFPAAAAGIADSPAPMAQGQPAPTFVDNGGRHPRRSPVPLQASIIPPLGSCHKPLYVKKLSFCVRASATSYYNLVIVGPGAL